MSEMYIIFRKIRGVFDTFFTSSGLARIDFPPVLYMCALHAHSGSCPPESSFDMGLTHLPTELRSSQNSALVRGLLSDGLPGGFHLHWSRRPRCSSDKERCGRDRKARQTRFSELWVRPRRHRAPNY